MDYLDRPITRPVSAIASRKSAPLIGRIKPALGLQPCGPEIRLHLRIGESSIVYLIPKGKIERDKTQL
jgi:hypothetical protein